MRNLQTGVIVTLGVIIFNLIIFSLIPLGIKKIVGIKKNNL